MKMQLVFGMLLAFAIASGAAFAATTTEPILGISSYSTVPAEVYAGTLGYLQITLTNTGSATAESVTAHYNLDGTGNTVSSGEISTGSSAQLSVPFKIRPESAGSIQTVAVDIFYSYTSSSGTSNKKTSLSVPLMVLQQNPLEARTVSMDRTSIAPGEQLSLELELKNTGGVINSLVITLPANSSFSLDGTTQKPVGSIATNASAKVRLVLLSSSSAEVGTYSVPIVFTYQDALRRPYSETLYVGPVSVLESSTQYRFYLEPKTPAEIGSQALFRLTLENTGSQPISAIADINSTSVFTPIGVQRLYFDSVAPGSKVSQDILLGITPSQSAGYYTLPVRLTQGTGQSATFNAGISVAATPEITVSQDGSSIQITNTGNSQIRSVYAIAKFKGSQATSESFIGTLSVDDFATLQLPSSTGGFASSQIEVVVRFKDSTNAEHVMNETLDSKSTVFSGQNTSSGSRQQASGGFNAGNRQSNPLGFIFGGGAARNAAGSSSGSQPDLLVIGGGILAVAVAGFLAYKYYWKKRKAK